MLAAAPGLVTTVNGCLRASVSWSAVMRVMRSVLPPATNGTTICTGRAGYSASAARNADATTRAAITVDAMAVRMIMPAMRLMCALSFHCFHFCARYAMGGYA